MENDLTDDVIRGYIYSGKSILVTGAGFDRSFLNIIGEETPSGDTLRKKLWNVAFPGEDEDASISLSIVYEYAEKNDPIKHKEILSNSFKIQSDSINTRFEEWLKVPWSSVYTFNVDNSMDLLLDRNDILFENYEVIDGLNPRKPSHSDRKQIVQIHGKINNYPNLTFTNSQYRKRMKDLDPWYTAFANALSYNRVFFVGTALNEPALEFYLEALGDEANNRRRSYPAFFVSPGDLSLKQKIALEFYNIIHLQMTEETFYQKFINNHLDDYFENLKPLSTSHSIHDITDLQKNAEPCNDDFLEGRTPKWGDLKSGYMVEFESVQELCNIITSENNSFILVRGSKGSGKTSLLMQASKKLTQQNKNVGWVDMNSQKSVPQIVNEANSTNYEYIFIDDIGKYSGRGLIQYKNVNATVIAAIRASKSIDLYGDDDLENVFQYDLPKLSQVDSQKLVDLLEKNKKLGKYLLSSNRGNREKTTIESVKSEIMNKLINDDHRYLLSTMILAYTGKAFSQYVWDECEEIASEDKISGSWQQKINATVSFLSRIEGIKVTESDITNICDPSGAYPFDVNTSLNSLLSRKIILKNSLGHISSKHRVIAEESLKYYKSIGILPAIIKSIAHWSYKNYDKNSLADDYFLILQKCINHKELLKLTDVRNRDYQSVELIYKEMQPIFSDYFHYWLQRGSFETEIGTDKGFELAANSFGYAWEIDPNNFNLRTAILYLELKQAIKTISRDQSKEKSIDSIKELCKMIKHDAQAKDSPNTVVVLLNTAIDLLSSGYIDPIDQMDIASKCYDAGLVAMGESYTQNNYVIRAWESFNYYIDDKMPLIKKTYKRIY